MGDRYSIPVCCPNCKHHEDNVYYAPTCGFTAWKCPKCGYELDLEEYTAISANEASNKNLLTKDKVEETHVARTRDWHSCNGCDGINYTGTAYCYYCLHEMYCGYAVMIKFLKRLKTRNLLPGYLYKELDNILSKFREWK